MKNKLLSFFCACVILNFSAQDKIRINADYDAAIGFHDNYSTDNNNYKSAFQNAAYVINGNMGGLNVNRSLIHFNLDTIPKDSKIKSVKLNLYALGNFGGVSGHIGQHNNAYISRVVQEWDVNKVTWNNQPKTNIKNRVELLNSTSFNQDYLSIDVTNLFKDVLDTLNFGIKLQLVNEDASNVGNALFFTSLDNGDLNKIPWIEVEYHSISNCNDSIKVTDAAIGYHDNYNTSSNNYFNALQNAAYVIPGNLGGLNVNRSLLFFDISSLPNNIDLLSAKLNLYAMGPIGSLPGHIGNENKCYLERVVNPWQEKVVNWDNQPKSVIDNRVTLENSLNSSQDYLDIDVTGLFKDILLSNSNNGLILKLQNEKSGNGLVFCSSDYKNGTKAPKLTICYRDYVDTSVTLVSTLYKNKELITFYPNPAKDQITIANSNYNFLSEYKLQVINQLGQVLFNDKMSTETKSISLNEKNINPGIYYISLSENDQVIFNQKIVVQ